MCNVRIIILNIDLGSGENFSHFRNILSYNYLLNLEIQTDIVETANIAWQSCFT